MEEVRTEAIYCFILCFRPFNNSIPLICFIYCGGQLISFVVSWWVSCGSSVAQTSTTTTKTGGKNWEVLVNFWLWSLTMCLQDDAGTSFIAFSGEGQSLRKKGRKPWTNGMTTHKSLKINKRETKWVWILLPPHYQLGIFPWDISRWRCFLSECFLEWLWPLSFLCRNKSVRACVGCT